MGVYTKHQALLLFLNVVLTTAIITTSAKVPRLDTFKYVNEGTFGPYITEYDASYRATPLSGGPFQLMWYNTTPGQFYVGLSMGSTQSRSLFRWVWDANRGKPVGENATLTLGTDGNLVLAEANGNAVWSTNTANKGVIGIKILLAGNIVLYDKQGKFVWQSFDHPTDTLMVGQSLYKRGPTKLVSRKSETENSDGIYSFVLEPKGLNLYVTPLHPNSTPLRYSGNQFSIKTYYITNVTFDIHPPPGEVADAYLLMFKFDGESAYYYLTRPKYNATLSVLRLQVDGNLVVYSYYIPVNYRSWETTFAYFAENGYELPLCSLPAKCGSLGLCLDEMCVACPTAKGLLGWSKSCAPPSTSLACKVGSAVDYYKVVGVEHFIPLYNKGMGKVKVEECKKRCSADCSCVGFFYWEESSSCWLAPLLGSLHSVSNSSHVAYIKKYQVL